MSACIFVANRGEIACRILRGVRALGLEAVACFTPPDAQALHLTLADRAWALPAPESYLDVAALVTAAKESGATAVHPGYGFLSQSPAFAEACAEAELTFVGPSPSSMRAIGDKRAARQLAQALAIPVVPGAEEVRGPEQVHAFAAAQGYPLLVKAAAAGGGRGLRRVDRAEDIAAAVAAARREAQASVGDDRLLVERWLTNVRHVEVQVVADGQRARALGDRECSLQRRFQKVVEEGPAACLLPATRAALYAASQRLFAAVHYRGVGTVEFLLDAEQRFYFLEVNPRLQVEHPVTELTAGVDLVAQQLAICVMGATLQELPAPAVQGHAIEVRLNAEDPARDFAPATGVVSYVEWPHGPGIRVDTGLVSGSHVTPHYDALLAKVVAHGTDREQARRRLLLALSELVFVGPATNLPVLQQILAHEDFVAGRTTTETLANMRFAPPAAWPAPLLAALVDGAQDVANAGHAAPVPAGVNHASPFHLCDGWRI